MLPGVDGHIWQFFAYSEEAGKTDNGNEV